MSEVIHTVSTGQTDTVGTLSLEMTSAQAADVAELGFYLDTDATRTGPFEADRVSTTATGFKYEKDILLGTGTTTIEPIFTLASGEQVAGDTGSFTSRVRRTYGRIEVQDAETPATSVRTLVFTGHLLVDVAGTEATISTGTPGEPPPPPPVFYWENVLGLSPTVLWKLNDSSGTVAHDASGNAHDGTFTNSPTLGQTGIIPNVADLSAYFGGGVDGATYGYVDRATDPDLAPVDSFTAIAYIKPQSLASEREVFGKVESFQLWLESTGQLVFYCNPAWASIASSTNLTVGTAYLVGVRKTPTNKSVWINGVKVGENAHTSTPYSGTSLRFGTSSTGPRYFHGNAEGFAYWCDLALTDEQMLDLYNASIAERFDPGQSPTAFTIAGIQAAAIYEDTTTLNVTWTSSTDPEAGPVEYRVQYSIVPPEGQAPNPWITLVDWEEGVLSYDWDLADVETGVTNMRVQAKDIDGNITTVETGGFSIVQNAPPSSPELSLDSIGSSHVVVRGSPIVDPDAGDTIAQVRWQLAETSEDFTALQQVTVDTVGNGNDVRNPSGEESIYLKTYVGLTPATEYKIRAQYQDGHVPLQKWSDWSLPLLFATESPSPREQIYLDLNPHALYQLDDNCALTGQVLKDSSGNAHDAALVQGFEYAYGLDPNNKHFYGPVRPGLGAGSKGLSYAWGLGIKAEIAHASWMEEDAIVIVAWCNVVKTGGPQPIAAYCNEAASAYPWICYCGPTLAINIWGATYSADAALVTTGISQCVWSIGIERLAIWQDGRNVLDLAHGYNNPPADPSGYVIRIGWYSTGNWEYGGPSALGAGNFDDIAFYPELLDTEIARFQDA
jgi:hypothetical protein